MRTLATRPRTSLWRKDPWNHDPVLQNTTNENAESAVRSCAPPLLPAAAAVASTCGGCKAALYVDSDKAFEWATNFVL